MRQIKFPKHYYFIFERYLVSMATSICNDSKLRIVGLNKNKIFETNKARLFLFKISLFIKSITIFTN